MSLTLPDKSKLRNQNRIFRASYGRIQDENSKEWRALHNGELLVRQVRLISNLRRPGQAFKACLVLVGRTR